MGLLVCSLAAYFGLCWEHPNHLIYVRIELVHDWMLGREFAISLYLRSFLLGDIGAV